MPSIFSIYLRRFLHHLVFGLAFAAVGLWGILTSSTTADVTETPSAEGSSLDAALSAPLADAGSSPFLFWIFLIVGICILAYGWMKAVDFGS